MNFKENNQQIRQFYKERTQKKPKEWIQIMMTKTK